MLAENGKLLNYIDGEWCPSNSSETLEVYNPATRELLGKTPISGKNDVDRAAESAQKALVQWRKVPATERIQYLFKLKTLLEENFEDLARLITIECGKTSG